MREREVKSSQGSSGGVYKCLGGVGPLIGATGRI